jgi:hypothetical protein
MRPTYVIKALKQDAKRFLVDFESGFDASRLVERPRTIGLSQKHPSDRRHRQRCYERGRGLLRR